MQLRPCAAATLCRARWRSPPSLPRRPPPTPLPPRPDLQLRLASSVAAPAAPAAVAEAAKPVAAASPEAVPAPLNFNDPKEAFKARHLELAGEGGGVPGALWCAASGLQHVMGCCGVQRAGGTRGAAPAQGLVSDLQSWAFAVGEAWKMPAVSPRPGALLHSSPPTGAGGCWGCLTAAAARPPAQAKSTGEIVRSLLVFKACKIGPLVRNADSLLRLSKRVFGSTLTNFVLRNTFYKQFVAGVRRAALFLPVLGVGWGGMSRRGGERRKAGRGGGAGRRDWGVFACGVQQEGLQEAAGQGQWGGSHAIAAAAALQGGNVQQQHGKLHAVAPASSSLRQAAAAAEGGARCTAARRPAARAGPDVPGVKCTLDALQRCHVGGIVYSADNEESESEESESEERECGMARHRPGPCSAPVPHLTAPGCRPPLACVPGTALHRRQRCTGHPAHARLPEAQRHSGDSRLCRRG